MSLSKASNNKHNRRSWEDSDFPILCETCLGDNPYVRMKRERYGKECKICTRLFTTFRWCPGHRMRFKKTEICQACSRMRNVCQTCVLDLVHGLPTQARDAVLNAERESSAQSGGKASRYKTALNRLRRTAPYYTRNRPRICSFWLRGECRRGDECPYRHEKSSSSNPFDSLREQNIKDRYFGRNDPVAKKMLERVGLISKLEPPMDKSLTTLYVGNLVHHITQRELHNVFYEYGDIRSISLITRQCCAFVQYNKRRDAELAIRRTFNKLSLKGRKATVNWARSQNKPVSRYAHTRRASRRSVEPDDLDLDATPPLLNYYANPYCA